MEQALFALAAVVALAQALLFFILTDISRRLSRIEDHLMPSLLKEKGKSYA